MRIEATSQVANKIPLVKRFHYENIKLDQSCLNVEIRNRMSRLPWRGQFSPKLIEYLMDTICPNRTVFYDPFCGSGTVLFEALRKERKAFGMEVNPAAWHLATLANFTSLTTDEKKNIYHETRNLALRSQELSINRVNLNNTSIINEIIKCHDHDFYKLVLAAVIVLGMGNERDLTYASISRGAIAVLSLFDELMDINCKASCFLNDARQVRFSNECIDAVITSPPYINVFNYHQNYRPAVELLGWNPLQAAPSEIGANRKHRMNRFLTIIQYCLDMSQCIDETSRLMIPNAPLIIILGRTSNVLGASIPNGALIKRLIELSGAFGYIQNEERVFTNRFGERIYEDIFITYRKRSGDTNLDDARLIGREALLSIRNIVPAKNQVILDIAVERAKEVQPSPLLNINIPKVFCNLKIKQSNGNAGY
jgi:hypothetical protein